MATGPARNPTGVVEPAQPRQLPRPRHLHKPTGPSRPLIAEELHRHTGQPARATPTSRASWGRSPPPAAKTNTFLGQRYRRLVKRCGKLKALVAVARSILVIIWHLLSDPASRFHDLGPDFYDNRLSPERTKRNHIRQLEALGYKVTFEPAA